jgi:hypothetical protein
MVEQTSKMRLETDEQEKKLWRYDKCLKMNINM